MPESITRRAMTISRHVIGGEFEVALEDLLRLLQSGNIAVAGAGAVGDAGEPSSLALPLLTRAMGRKLRASFTGLPPNGMDFGIWLWETAPLHVASLLPAGGSPLEARHVLYPLRRIAADILGLYVEEQPDALGSVIPLLDASADDIDARLLIGRGLSAALGLRFPAEAALFLPWLDAESPWRRMLPPEALRAVVAARPEESAEVLALLRPQLLAAQPAPVAQSHRRLLRTAALKGDRAAFMAFLAALRTDGATAALATACAAALSCRVAWDEGERTVLRFGLREA